MRREVKIGLIVFGAIAILVWGLNFLKGKDLFSNQTYYYAVYNNVDGLKSSNAILLNGFRVGKVENVSLMKDNSGRVLVELMITEKIILYDQTEARITSSDFLGSKVIELTIQGNKVINNRDTLKSSIEKSLTSTINETVAPLKAKTEKLLGSLDTLVNVLSTALNKKTTDNISKSFENIYKTFNNVERITAKMDSSLKFDRIQAMMDSFKQVADNFNNNKVHLNKIMANLSNVSDSLAKANFANTIMNVNKTLNEFSTSLEKVNSGQGSIGLLLNDEQLYNNMNKSSEDLDKLLLDIKENPKRYIHFSVFGKKDKKAK